MKKSLFEVLVFKVTYPPDPIFIIVKVNPLTGVLGRLMVSAEELFRIINVDVVFVRVASLVITIGVYISPFENVVAAVEKVLAPVIV